MSGLPPPPQPSDPDQPGWAAPPGAVPPPVAPPPGWGAPPTPGWAPPSTPGWGPPGPPGWGAPPGTPGWAPPSTPGWGPPGPHGAYRPPPSKGGLPAWGWALIALGGLFGLAVVAIIAITFLGESSSSRFEPVGSQIETYGDDPTFDRLWDQCESGNGQACDDLFWRSPIGSEYEQFGDTCGHRYSEFDAPLSCAEELRSGSS